jgi:hypothetical protein
MGITDNVARLDRREFTRAELSQALRGSEEFQTLGFTGRMLGYSIHAGRCLFIKSLPEARRILDLGGTHQWNDHGAMVALGYPYPFEELTIIDLPSPERHAIYRSDDARTAVNTPLGPVSYHYHSMTDLSAFADSSVDLVYSGQSIEVTPSGGSPVLAGWKEAGGSAAAFSPNAAFLQAPYAMSAGTTYLVEVVWKANRPAIGATVATGAGPIGSGYSPTELTAQILPAGAQSVVSTLQYKLAKSDGSTWQEMDPSRLVTSFSPAQSEDAVISGNADLWTGNAGYNQDLGIFVSEDGGPSQLLAWTEAGGAAATFSPSAVSVQTVYPVVVGNTYVFSLGWKANWPAQGTAIFAGAGPIDGAYSPTRLTVYPLAPQWPGSASNLQYRLPGSDGSTWHEMDATNLAVTLTASSSESVVASGGTALFTGSPGYNQDLAVFVSVNGGTPLLLAWEESGGSAGTFSPDAATVDAVYPVTSGNTYVFSLGGLNRSTQRVLTSSQRVCGSRGSAVAAR